MIARAAIGKAGFIDGGEGKIAPTQSGVKDISSSPAVILGIAQPDADRGPHRVAFRGCDRIGAIVGGIEGARPVIARQADAAEGGGGRGAVGRPVPVDHAGAGIRSEEHTSELQSLMRISYAVFCLKKKNEK